MRRSLPAFALWGVTATACAVAIIFGCGCSPSAPQEVVIDGSSTVFPVTEAVAEEFQGKMPNVRVTVGVSGTGGGFKKFTRGETDISAASRPILKAEAEQATAAGIEFIELPICYDALTIAVHPSCDWIKDDTITIAQLKKIWEPDAQGKIMKWNQIEPDWPDAEIKLYGPGSDSGTFDYFTEVVCGKAKQSRGDFTASEDDNTLVQGISGDKHALGYLPFAYFEPNSSKMKALKVKKGDAAVGPSIETVKDASYPLSRPLFIYVSQKSLAKPEVLQFTEFYLDSVTTLATEVKYVPFESALYDLVKLRLKQRQTGSLFGGDAETHQTLTEALKAAPK